MSCSFCLRFTLIVSNNNAVPLFLGEVDTALVISVFSYIFVIESARLVENTGKYQF